MQVFKQVAPRLLMLAVGIIGVDGWTGPTSETDLLLVGSQVQGGDTTWHVVGKGEVIGGIEQLVVPTDTPLVSARKVTSDQITRFLAGAADRFERQRLEMRIQRIQIKLKDPDRNLPSIAAWGDTILEPVSLWMEDPSTSPTYREHYFRAFEPTLESTAIRRRRPNVGGGAFILPDVALVALRFVPKSGAFTEKLRQALGDYPTAVCFNPQLCESEEIRGKYFQPRGHALPEVREFLAKAYKQRLSPALAVDEGSVIERLERVDSALARDFAEGQVDSIEAIYAFRSVAAPELLLRDGYLSLINEFARNLQKGSSGSLFYASYQLGHGMGALAASFGGAVKFNPSFIAYLISSEVMSQDGTLELKSMTPVELGLLAERAAILAQFPDEASRKALIQKARPGLLPVVVQMNVE